MNYFPFLNNLISKSLQLTGIKDLTRNTKYSLFHDYVYFVPTLSFFTGLVTYSFMMHGWLHSVALCDYMIYSLHTLGLVHSYYIRNHHSSITEALMYNIMQLYQPSRPFRSIILHMIATIHFVNKMSF